MRISMLIVCVASVCLLSHKQGFAQEAEPENVSEPTDVQTQTEEPEKEPTRKIHGLEESSDFSLMKLECPFFQSLSEQGLTFGLGYTADFFSNTHGGLSTNGAFQYRGFLDFNITLETEPLGLWDGGTFFINFFNFHGIDITERYVGDLQYVNINDSPNDSKVYEFWYQQALFEDRLRIKLGKMDVNCDFATGEHRNEFINASGGVSPTIPMVTWPNTGLGIAVFVEPVDWLYFGAGIFDALGESTRIGFDTAFHSPDESFSIFELGFRPELNLFGQQGLPGK